LLGRVQLINTSDEVMIVVAAEGWLGYYAASTDITVDKEL